jgi:hypothetical protein
VRDVNEPQLDTERVLVFDDVQLDRRGQIKPPGWWIESHNGRVGSTRLVNGRREPELTIAAGHVERWRIVNAASARYLRLSIGNRPFRILGTDGGLIEVPFGTTEVLLSPADRVDLAVGPFEEGESLDIESGRYNRGAFGIPKRERFATLRVGRPGVSRAQLPERLRTIEPLVQGNAVSTREIHLGWKLSKAHGVEFTINREVHHRAEPCPVGELQIWDLINGSPVDHPFHLHGFFFQVVDVNGSPPPFLSWEDTVNVPARGRVRIAWVPDDRPGEWMYHCHILEHHAAGMMAHFDVVPAGGVHPALPDGIESPRLEGDSPQQLRIDRDDDGAQRHQHGADRGRQHDAVPRQHPGRERDGDDIVAGRPPEVLHHLPVTRPAQPDDPGDVARIAPDEHDIAGFDGDIRAGADRNAHVRGDERGSVVHAIAHHRDAFALRLQLLDSRRLAFGQYLREHRVDPQLPRDRARNRL